MHQQAYLIGSTCLPPVYSQSRWGNGFSRNSGPGRQRCSNEYNQCRKYKCNNIDARLDKKKEELFGTNYDNYIQTKIEKKCPLTLKNKQRKNCETKNLKKIYTKHTILKLYNKLLECNKTLCFKDKQNFYNAMLKKKTIKLTKIEKDRINEIKKIQTPDPDIYLIKNGDL